VIEVISAERRSLAQVLDLLTEEQWQAESLCEGWTSAHVAAHLTMPFRITTEQYMAGVQAADGDFTTFSNSVAERDAKLPKAELVAVLRDNADNPWTPPGAGLIAPLSHDVIHGLDITWPLGADWHIPDRALTSVLDMLVGDGTETVFGVPITGLSLHADDLGWSWGSGAAVRGRGRDLVPLLGGRRIPLDQFSGPGVTRLSATIR
jgi:uncharacterized protein (TIGR03083 family)